MGDPWLLLLLAAVFLEPPKVASSESWEFLKDLKEKGQQKSGF